jgi:probable HAF family extracellular repeat protein
LCLIVFPIYATSEYRRPIDLGTLGGASSVAVAVNSTGQVIGVSDTGLFDPDTGVSVWHAFSWTARGGMVDLGTNGYRGSTAVAVNDLGQVIGTVFNENENVDPQAFLWTADHGMRELGTLGGTTSVATAINNFGQVVGTSATATGEFHAFSWTARGGMVDLGVLAGGLASSATDVNDRGQVVGGSQKLGATEIEDHAVMWKANGRMIDLGPSDLATRAWAISAGGHVMGYAYPPGAQGGVTFRWTARHGMVLTRGLGGWDTFAMDVNATGQIVGYSHLPGSDVGQSNYHPFLWTVDGRIMDLGTNTERYGWANAINEAGQVVGTAGGQFDNGVGEPGLHAFSWTARGGRVDLRVPGEDYSDAVGVNDRGQIVGNVTFPFPVGTRAVLWRPMRVRDR